MYKEFETDCNCFIKEVLNNIELSSKDLLLWIYLNMYFHQQFTGGKETYSRKIFTEKIQESKNFNGWGDIYNTLGEAPYNLLREKILQRYSYKNMESVTEIQLVELKEMEILYEGFLLDGVRSKTGTYYTPQPIVYYMVVKSLLTYLRNQFVEVNGELTDFIMGQGEILERDMAFKLLGILKSIRIIDIACGGGVFLREALKVLFQLEKKLNYLLGLNINEGSLVEDLLRNTIYGIDIQSSTVFLCKLLLLMQYEILGGEKRETELRIICSNALIIEDTKDWVWSNSFDIVLGNPPYIGERGNKTIFNEIKESPFGQKYYEGKMDYFYFFIYRGGNFLKKGGTLGFITTNYFVTADGGEKLRLFLRENFAFKEIINFNESNIFKDAQGQHNMIFIAVKDCIEDRGPRMIFVKDKKLHGEEVVDKLLKDTMIEGICESTLKIQGDLYDDRGQILIQSSMDSAKLLKKIATNSYFTLGDLCHVNQGIVSGADRLSGPWAEKLGRLEDKGRGIFVLTEEEVFKNGFDKTPYLDFLEDFYKNSYIKKYYLLKNQGLKIIYLDDEEPEDIMIYPGIHQHLLNYKPLLEERREVKLGRRKWYALQWPRKREIFEGEKIVVPQRSLENTFAYHRGPWYASADVYYITLKNNTISLLAMLAILNSSLVYFWLFYRGKRKGEYLELYGTPLKAIPFPSLYEPSGLLELENLVREIERNLSGNKDILDLQQQLDDLVYNLYQLSEDEKNMIRELVKERGILK